MKESHFFISKVEVSINTSHQSWYKAKPGAQRKSTTVLNSSHSLNLQTAGAWDLEVAFCQGKLIKRCISAVCAISLSRSDPGYTPKVPPGPSVGHWEPLSTALPVQQNSSLTTF